MLDEVHGLSKLGLHLAHDALAELGVERNRRCDVDEGRVALLAHNLGELGHDLREQALVGARPDDAEQSHDLRGHDDETLQVGEDARLVVLVSLRRIEGLGDHKGLRRLEHRLALAHALVDTRDVGKQVGLAKLRHHEDAGAHLGDRVGDAPEGVQRLGLVTGLLRELEERLGVNLDLVADDAANGH